MNAIRCWMCRLICGEPEQRTQATGGVPFEVRELSHDIANAVGALQGSTKRLDRETSALRALTEAVKSR